MRPNRALKSPTVRPTVHDAYWRFAHERQRIFHRRARGDAPPWTDDAILAEHKFCNTYRASDRVSQFLIRDVIYGSAGRDLAPEDVAFRIVFFRLFSKESTWRALEDATGGVTLGNFAPPRLADVLDHRRRRGPIYTAAFILCAHDAFGQPSKHRNHLALLEEMFVRRRIGRDLARVRSLQEVYEMLRDLPLLGPFMAYQLAIDLNYSELLDFSENDFTQPGPGALRGLRKVFTDFGGESPQHLILRTVDRQEEEFERLGLPFENLFGRRLHAIDCQSLYCEVDKYSRAAWPELKSARVRIKARFHPSPEPFDLFYPPKWGLNESLPRAGSRKLQLKLLA